MQYTDPGVNTAVSHLQDAANNEPTSSEEEEEEDDEEDVEIDEMSEGEDDRRAHELLRAPVQVEAVRGSPPVSLPYDNYAFVVGLFVASMHSY